MKIRHIVLRVLHVGLAAVTAGTLAAATGWNGGADLTFETANGLSPGLARRSALHGAALGYASWQSAADAPANQFYASALALAGQGPTERFLGDFLAASNIEGHNSVRLYAWWFEANRGHWSLRAGALLADEEFTGTGAGGTLINSVFGWPAFISANTVNTGPAFFVAAPGARLQYAWNESVAWRLGIYDGDTFDSPAGDPHATRHGLHYRVGGDQGWFVIGELTFAPAGGPARFKAGAWLHTATFPDVRDDDSGRVFAISGADPRQHSSNHGAYGVVETTLAGKVGEAGNVEGFFRAGFSPADRNTLGWVIDTGLSGTGLIPRRPNDVTTLGFAHAKFSRRYADGMLASAPADPAPDYEQIIELSHAVVLSEHFQLQPDLQLIRHPGGSTAQRDAVIFLLRFKASF
jgi:porin